MSIEALLNFVPVFVLVFFRIAGMMVAAPLFGSARVPRRVKLYFAVILAMGFTPGVRAAAMPDTVWELAVGIGAELAFGLAIGTMLSFVFIAVHWAGEIVGQQMGLGMGQIFDPQYGQSGSVVGELYFMLTLVVFLVVRGHHAFLRGLHASFEALPLLSVTMTRDLLDLVLDMLQAATGMAIQLAAPILLTMLVVDVVLGFIGKTIPQMNVMASAMSVRPLLGIVVLLVGLSLSSEVIRDFLLTTLREVSAAWGA